MRKYEEWLSYAERDIKFARVALREGFLTHCCFLSHQCVEKSLKAYLVSKGQLYPKSHHLPELLSLCEASQRTFSRMSRDCNVLNPHYIPTRYPDMAGKYPQAASPSKADAADALRRAKRVFNFVKEIIKYGNNSNRRNTNKS
jgi:HEPN domain-containing protein